MKIVVAVDIIIDLIEAGLLDGYFGKSFDVYTTDIVIHRLGQENTFNIESYWKQSDNLHIASFEGVQMIEMLQFYTKCKTITNLSIEDCSVLYFAKQHNCILLADDTQLLKLAKKDGVEAIERNSLLNYRQPCDGIIEQSCPRAWNNDIYMKGGRL